MSVEAEGEFVEIRLQRLGYTPEALKVAMRLQ